MNFQTEAQNILLAMNVYPHSLKVEKLATELKRFYELGKKHLHDPSHLIGETKIVTERDTHLHQ